MAQIKYINFVSKYTFGSGSKPQRSNLKTYQKVHPLHYILCMFKFEIHLHIELQYTNILLYVSIITNNNNTNCMNAVIFFINIYIFATKLMVCK